MKWVCITLLGFSSGLPLALTGATLQAWMKTENVDLTTIGIFSLVALPYTLKFLWSPFLDRYRLPFLGRRRGWILLTQIALALGFAAMAVISPSRMPTVMAVAAFLVTFLAASQDIVIDAWRTDILETSEYGMGAAMTNVGYRIAMLTSGALALILADHVGFTFVYLVMAASMSVGAVATLMSPEREVTRVPKTLKDAVILPFQEFFSRPGALEVLVFAVLYKLDAVLAQALTTPFQMEMGFSKTEIGAVAKTVGLVAVIAGTTLGGALMLRWEMRRSLWIFGWFQGVAGVSYVLLAHFGHNYPMMVTTNAAEYFCSGLGNAAYSAFLMSLCDKRYTATQFALLTSLMAFTRTVGAAPAGWLVLKLGWDTYYFITLFAGIPALLMLYRFPRWQAMQLGGQTA
jgi:PAT family beta-lactamase induction signal transducer AmpG